MWMHILTTSLNRVLLHAPEKKHLYFINECFFDTHVYTGQLDNSLEPQFRSTPTDFILQGSNIVFSPVPNDDISNLRKFAEYKQMCYYDLLTKIALARVKEQDKVTGQAEIYKMKYDQALLLQQNNYDPTNINAPLVVDYAELDNCTIKQSADQIILQYTMHQESVQKTEWFRIKYLRLIKQSQTAEELSQIAKELHKETFLNILL